MKLLIVLKLHLVIICFYIGFACSSSPESNEDVEQNKPPKINGFMVFHSYSSYDAIDSKLFLYDFTKDQLIELSRNWQSVKHTMNGHISPDGKDIIFMGIGSESQSWDIFRYRIGSDGEPEILIPNSPEREEDPKYAPDGKAIIYKKNHQLQIIHIPSKEIIVLTQDHTSEYSMPYFTMDQKWAISAKGTGSSAEIVKVNIENAHVETIADRIDVLDYYPIVIDNERFYFTSNYSSENAHDQIYIGYLDGRFPNRLNMNSSDANYSDPYPINSDWLLISSTREDTRGGYDIYIVHTKQKTFYSLSEYNAAANTSKNDLGAVIFIHNKKEVLD